MRNVVPLALLAAAAAVAASARVQNQQRMVVIGAIAVGAMLVVLWLRMRLKRPRIRDWRDAEDAAADWLRKAGCREVGLTGGSADGGIDVVTANWAVQVKHTGKRVGRPVAQQVVGASLTLGRQPAVISTSGFTAPAVIYAAEHDVALLELDLNGQVHRVNPPAHLVGKRPSRRSRRL